MADILIKVDETVLPNLARAIMKKTGKSDPLTLPQFQAEVESIESGGSVSEPVLQEKTATENGVVTPDANYDGLSKVNVNVSEREVKLQNKTITENGTFVADSGYDGLGEVEVNVASSGGGIGVSVSGGAKLPTFDNVYDSTLTEISVSCNFSTELSE